MAKPFNNARSHQGLVENWKRPDKSGLQVAPMTHKGFLCRQALKANAEASRKKKQ